MNIGAFRGGGLDEEWRAGGWSIAILRSRSSGQPRRGTAGPAGRFLPQTARPTRRPMPRMSGRSSTNTVACHSTKGKAAGVDRARLTLDDGLRQCQPSAEKLEKVAAEGRHDAAGRHATSGRALQEHAHVPAGGVIGQPPHACAGSSPTEPRRISTIKDLLNLGIDSSSTAVRRPTRGFDNIAGRWGFIDAGRGAARPRRSAGSLGEQAARHGDLPGAGRHVTELSHRRPARGGAEADRQSRVSDGEYATVLPIFGDNEPQSASPHAASGSN